MKLKFVLLVASIANNATAFFVPTPQSCHHLHQSIMKSVEYLDMIEEEQNSMVDEEKRRLEEETTKSHEDIDIENIEEELSASMDEFVEFQKSHDAFLKNQQEPAVVSYPFLKRRKREEQTEDDYIPAVMTNQPHADSLFLGDDISDITGLPFVSATASVASSSQQEEIEMDRFGFEEADGRKTPFLIALNTFDDDDVVEGSYEIAGTA